ncbi:kanadaptin-like [Pollicipes pollicipes]|uniref:kanadaptin-like n=1 Tax=Pollicipes pollicipes TaxID=41117 RepID=UPI001884C94F|nr:kanadaptin-like [Pollicipes pollicipes]
MAETSHSDMDTSVSSVSVTESEDKCGTNEKVDESEDKCATDGKAGESLMCHSDPFKMPDILPRSANQIMSPSSLSSESFANPDSSFKVPKFPPRSLGKSESPSTARSNSAGGPVAGSEQGVEGTGGPTAARPAPQPAEPARPAGSTPYKPPAWAGSPPHAYSLEVVRGGQLVDTVELQHRASLVFGRLPDCDVRLEHPSISRHHAVLVYRWVTIAEQHRASLVFGRLPDCGVRPEHPSISRHHAVLVYRWVTIAEQHRASLVFGRLPGCDVRLEHPSISRHHAVLVYRWVTIAEQHRASLVFGRLPDYDVRLEHPFISRHHAVLVYRLQSGDSREAGFYLYDLGSTHGTTLNKTPVQPKVYCRMRVGHMCKFGGSSRLFILQGPEEDREAESELTVTELMEIGRRRQEQMARLEEAAAPDQAPPPAARLRPELADAETADDQGVSWGMGEDADEANDLQFNPFALGEAENEQLYLVDPKRTLRGWFEREGYELEYQTEEQAGQRHVCRITLPLDTDDGRPLVAEAQHVGKKKEAVFQCALEACRMLDRAGVLRQARQESRQQRRRKPAADDSDDDDTFLDRTGAVEKKRQKRQQAAAGASAAARPDTYQSLLLQYQRVQSNALAVERRLAESEAAAQQPESQPGEMDELDAFMSSLSRGGIGDRQERRRLKTQLTQLRAEEGRLCRLVNLARPASMPPLRPPPQAAAVRSALTGIIGKRKQKAGRCAAPARAVRGPERRVPSGPAVEDEDEVEDERKRRRKGRSRSDGCRPVRPPSSQPPPAGSRPTARRRDSACPPRSRWRAARPRSPGPGPKRTGAPATCASRWKGPRTRCRRPVSAVWTTRRIRRCGARTRSPSAGRCSPSTGRARRRVPGLRSGTVDQQHSESAQQQADKARRKREERTRRKAEKEVASEPYSRLAGDGTYDVWVPPADQSGDGRTSLNDKYGY